jgi:lysozyme family protein
MSVTTFDQAWAFLQRPDIEGGATLVTDAGGLTKYGISQHAYPAEDIANLTEDRAKFLFKRDYWDPCRCDDLPPRLALSLADAAFNEGQVTAVRLLQQSLRIPADGIVGPQTLALAPGANINDFLSRRLLRYADGDPASRHGWFMRVLRLKDALAVL